jgi:hypothetical protein
MQHFSAVQVHGLHASQRARLAADAIERRLVHAVSDSGRRLYKHAQGIPERTAMMRDWADHLDELRRHSHPRRFIPVPDRSEATR